MTTQSKLLSFALVGVFIIAGITASLLWRRPAAPVQFATGALNAAGPA